jgi:hypothetical protein
VVDLTSLAVVGSAVGVLTSPGKSIRLPPTVSLVRLTSFSVDDDRRICVHRLRPFVNPAGSVSGG